MRLMRRRSPADSTTSILENSALARFDLRRRKWLLPPLVRTILPVPVTRKRLAAALYVFSLYFFDFLFGISIPHKKAPAGAFSIIYDFVGQNAFGYAMLSGVNVKVIDQPSNLGCCSMDDISSNSSAISNKASRPISG